MMPRGGTNHNCPSGADVYCVRPINYHDREVASMQWSYLSPPEPVSGWLPFRVPRSHHLEWFVCIGVQPKASDSPSHLLSPRHGVNLSRFHDSHIIFPGALRIPYLLLVQ